MVVLTTAVRLWRRERVASLGEGLGYAFQAARGLRPSGGALLCRAGMLCFQVCRGLGAHKAGVPERILVACSRAAALRRLVSALCCAVSLCQVSRKASLKYHVLEWTELKFGG